MTRFSLHKSNILMLFMLIDAFLWYYLTLNIIAIISETLSVEQAKLLSFYSSGVLVSGIIGILFSKNRYKILVLWNTLGTVTSILPLLTPTLLYFHLICFAWGFSFGLGIPICLAYFAENTAIENRGHLSGITLLVSFSCAIPIANLFYSFESLALYSFFSLWRLLGFFPLFILREEHKKSEIKKNSGNYVGSIMRNKIFYLYFVPWFVFNIVDVLEGALLKNFLKAILPGHYALLQIMFLFSISIFAFLSGLLCDLIGRKPVTIAGFAAMGIAYAVISITPSSLPAWFLFSICYGFSSGLFNTLFILVVWGDLAPKDSKEKYYFVGNAPFFLATLIQSYLADYVKLLSESSAFSLAAILLFLAVIPILYAPETLPESEIRRRELKSYIEKAKKIAGKSA